MIVLSALAFFGLCGALGGIGLVSWRRTEMLRRGRRPRSPPTRPHVRTSRVTTLAAWSGLAAAAWGGISLASRVPSGLALLAGGTIVAVAGGWARVSAIELSPYALRLRYARGPDFTIPWSEVHSLRPPRTPLGGWRIVGEASSTTLMPSDLWGHEWVLHAIVQSADLLFDGRGWARVPPSQPTSMSLASGPEDWLK